MHSSWFRSTFKEPWNLYKLKSWALIFWRSQFGRKSELFGLPFCISFLNTLWTQIHNHSLDFNAFCMIQEYFSRVLKFLQINMEGPNFSREPILQKVWITWFLFLYFNFKRFMDPNSSSFIRFQCISHDSGILFSESWNF